jgi:hypothetical protein
MRLRFSITALFLVLSAGMAAGDEGLWTFDKFPAEKVRAAYGFAPDSDWLTRVRDGTVLLDSGCSGGLVSAEGLVQTSYHCVGDCIHSLSGSGFDPNRDPLTAPTRAEERTCPGVHADIVTAISDVTAAIAAAKKGLAGEAALDARDAAIERIESGCRDETAGKHCEVVPLYGGSLYSLHRYRRYADVRLVFAPEAAAGTFGGDPDNFNFPRYAFDVAYLRLYENGVPAKTPLHLKWRSTPLAYGEFVFVSGSPGETGRLWPMSMISYLREVYLPWSLVTGAELRGRLLAFAAGGPEQARISHDFLYEIENNYKDEWGELAALSTPAFVARLQAAENELRNRARGLGLLSAGEGDPFEDMAKAFEDYRSFFFAYRYIEEAGNFSTLFGNARDIVRAAFERTRPEADRLEGYSDVDLPLVEDRVLADVPAEPALEELKLSFWLSKAREFLTADDPLLKKLLGRESPEALAHRLVSGSELGDIAVRRRLIAGGAVAVGASTDPLIAFVRGFEPDARALAERHRKEVSEIKIAALERIAVMRFKVYGDAVYPDASGTLRLSYGSVAGWTEPTGRQVAPFTDFAGLFERATGADPYRLAPTWEAVRGKLSPQTIFDVSTNNDIIGGNSGSPLLDRNGEVVGCVFDGNIHSLGGFYLFDPELNRTVALASTAIEEALAKVYGLQRIVDELKH